MVCRDFCGRPVVETLHVREGHSGCPPPGDLPNPGIEPKSPILQVDSLPSDPSEKPMNTGAGSLSFFQEIFLTQELNQGLLHWQADSLPAELPGSLCDFNFFSLSWLSRNWR